MMMRTSCRVGGTLAVHQALEWVPQASGVVERCHRHSGCDATGITSDRIVARSLSPIELARDAQPWASWRTVRFRRGTSGTLRGSSPTSPAGG